METVTWMEQRNQTSRKRLRPRMARALRFEAQGNGEIGLEFDGVPTDILIEATDSEGDTPRWFDDWFWLECLNRWKDERLTVHILPSSAALLHPVVLHHLVMVRRVAPAWRLAGHVWIEELDMEISPAPLARSPYHELRIIDAPRPGVPESMRNPFPPRINDLFGAIRDEQEAIERTFPMLVRTTESPDTE